MRFTEHLQRIPCIAVLDVSLRLVAIFELFDVFLSNAQPMSMRTAFCGMRLVGTLPMSTQTGHSPLAYRPREAAKPLGSASEHSGP